MTRRSTQLLVLWVPTDPFPGQNVVDEDSAMECFDRFESFVGTPYQDSALDITFITPIAGSWAEGEREVVCAVYRLDGQPLVGTARGSGV